MEEWYTVSSLYPERPDSNLDIRCMSLYNGRYLYEEMNNEPAKRKLIILHIPNDDNSQQDHLRKAFSFVGDILSITIRFSNSMNEYYAVLTFHTINYNKFVNNMFSSMKRKNNTNCFVSCCIAYTKWEPSENYAPLIDDMLETFIRHYKEHHTKIQEIEVYDVYYIQETNEDEQEEPNFDIITHLPNYDITKRLYNALTRNSNIQILKNRLEKTVNNEPDDFYGNGEDMYYIL